MMGWIARVFADGQTLLIEIALALVGSVFVFLAGYAYRGQVEAGKQARETVRYVDRVIEHHNDAAVAGNAVEANTLNKQQRQEVYTRQLLNEMSSHAKQKPVVGSDCRLDSYSMYRWRAANRGAAAAAPREPDAAAARATAGAEEQHAGGVGGEPHRDSEYVSPVAQPAAGAGGVDQ